MRNKQFIAVLDPGLGNIRSVLRAAVHCCGDSAVVTVTSEKTQLAEADKIIFPGQGAARDCMETLYNRQLTDVLCAAATSRPFLGICLGMQALMEYSMENDGVECLNILSGFNRPLTRTGSCKIPHIGWNSVEQIKAHPLWHAIPNSEYFYFDHSYQACPRQDSLKAGISVHAAEFVCALADKYIFATQFHPEKSSDAGLQILRNFAGWGGG